MKANFLKDKQADTPQLYDFIGSRFQLFFHLAGLDPAWLQFPVQQWDTSQGYQSFKLYVSSMNVVNDAPERTVKDVIEFVYCSQDPGRRDEVFQVFNSHRELINFRHLID